MTMIELVLAVAIAAIVLSMIMLFISRSADGFRHTSETVNLQMEAQTAINHLSNLAMEAVELNFYTTLEDKRFTFRFVRKDASYHEYEEYITIIYGIASRKLYHVSVTDYDQAKTVIPVMKNHFLADYIEDLRIENSPDNKSLTIYLVLSLGEDKYELNKKVKLRNRN